MSHLPHPERSSIVNGEKEDEPVGGVTRRGVLAGAAATTAAVSVGGISTPASAQSGNPNSSEDMILFVLLSAALTGVFEAKLAPGFGPKDPRIRGPERVQFIRNLKLSDFPGTDFGSDPVDIKRQYFDWVNKKKNHSATFRRLLQIAKDSLNASDRAEAIIDRVNATPDTNTKYLARSIVLMWYLGAWYEPDNLRELANAFANQRNPPPWASKFEVISPTAYTQGWAWRVARAHPMGFSEMQFGYWARPPRPLAEFIGS
jgi:hypothetical protein